MITVIRKKRQTINCECGCKFKFTPEDVKCAKMSKNWEGWVQRYVECPICRDRHILSERLNCD